MSEQTSFYHKVEKFTRRLAEGMTLLSGFLLMIGVILTVISIAGRAMTPLGLSALPGDYELVETFVGLAIFSFMPFCQFKRGHVGVDLFVMMLGNRAMNFTQLIGDIVVTGLFMLLTWRHLYGTIDKYHSHDTSFILGFPLWWGFAVAFVMMLAICFICLFTIWRDIRDLKGNTVFTSDAGAH